MTEQALQWLSLYGSPVLFLILAASSFGVPMMPAALTMLIVGSFVEQGEIELWQAIVIGTSGAILGDQTGYLIGRFGGRGLIDRITDRFGGADRVVRAEEFSMRWGGIGIFFSRWLVTPLGPWLNLISGVTGYGWTRFTILGALGETLWVVVYIVLGITFSDRVQATADLFVNLSWLLVGIVISAALGWKVVKLLRNKKIDRLSAP